MKNNKINIWANINSMYYRELVEFFESKDFTVHDSETEFEIETWTNGGVNMFVCFKDTDEFFDYVESFDIDEQIMIHRGDKLYCDNFTIRESLKDFESYHKRLKQVAKELKKLIKFIKINYFKL